MKHTYQLRGMATTLRMRTTISPEFHPITSSRYYSLSNVLLRGENEAKERGRQARNIYNKCSENSRPEIVFRTDVFRKLTLGAPECCSFYPLSLLLSKHNKYHVHITFLPWKVSISLGLNWVYRQPYPGCQRLFMRGFRFRSSLNSCLRPVADETKLLVAREKNLWYPGYVSRQMP